MNSEAANLIQSLCMLAKRQQGLNLQQQCCLHWGAVQPDCLVSMPLRLPVHCAILQRVLLCAEDVYAVVISRQRSTLVGSMSGLVQRVVAIPLQIIPVRAYHHMPRIKETKHGWCAGVAGVAFAQCVVGKEEKEGEEGGATCLASPSSRHCLPCFRLFLTISTRCASALKAALPGSSSIARLY